ncbi:hypothetical protein F4777DRAFT_597194 [Nemania sp. FL0916]|nr:hypothetical protein F4777DRAFT_597194 [Nemania sp. FL0916]
MDVPVDTGNLPHDNRAYVVIAVVVSVIALATIAVGLRIYTRAYLVKHVGADDYLALLALISAISTGISQCINTKNGLGKHSWDLEAPDEIIRYFKNFYVSIAFYNAGLMAVKLTFLAQYYRALALKRFQTVCIVAMIIVGAWSLSQVLVGLFICTPVAGFWDKSLHARCIPVPLQWYVNAGGNIISDIIVFVLPLPVLTHLNLPKVQRLTLVGIFSLGFFTCAISVIRIKYLKQGGDFSYQNVEASSWSITELCSGVICVCLPTLRPFVQKYVPKLAGTIHRSSIGYKRHSGSKATDVGEEMKHSRQNSKESNFVSVKAEEEFRRPNTRFDIDTRTSGDTSDGIIGLRSTREGLYGQSRASLTKPEPTYAPSQVRTNTTTHLSWIRPGVTTTITSGAREPGTCDNSSTIHITRDIMMQEISPSKA